MPFIPCGFFQILVLIIEFDLLGADDVMKTFHRFKS